LKNYIKAGLYLLTIPVGLVLLLIIISYRQDIPVKKLESKYFTKESRYIDVNDVRLHVRKRGSGPVIFLLHGSFASLHTWNEWENELSESFTTISLDLPGHGLTGPNGSGVYSTDYCSNLVFSLADTLRIDTFYVAGNSMGGHVAWHMALQNPERVKKIILVNAAGYRSVISDTTEKPTERPFIFKLLGNKLIASLFTSLTPRFLFKQNLKQVYGNPENITKEQVDRYYDLMLRDGNRKATLQRLGQSGKSLQVSINQIQIPTLILWGAKDNWIPVSHAYHFQEEIPNASLAIFPSAGHIPMEEIPQETVKPVIDFLKIPLGN